MDMTFTDFDWRARTARIIGNQAAVSATAWQRVFADSIQMVFLEETPAGSAVLTSVFFDPAEGWTGTGEPMVRSKQASVVHSRHISIGPQGSAIVSQYTGVCDIKL